MNQGSWQAVGKDSFRNVYLFCFCFKGRMAFLSSYLFHLCLCFFSTLSSTVFLSRRERIEELQASNQPESSTFCPWIHEKCQVSSSTILGFGLPSVPVFILLHTLASSWVLQCFLFLLVDAFCSQGSSKTSYLYHSPNVKELALCYGLVLCYGQLVIGGWKSVQRLKYTSN